MAALYLWKNPHELRWILIMIRAHTKKLCEVKKKRALGDTFNSHNPLLTRISAESEAALKVRGDASTYINHERSHQTKNSNAHKRHSASVCKHFCSLYFHTKASIHVFFFEVFLMIHLFCHHVCYGFKALKAHLYISAELFLSSHHYHISVFELR